MKNVQLLNGWENEFIAKKSLAKQFLFSATASAFSLSLMFGVFNVTGIYFSSLIISTAILISFYSSFLVSLLFAIILGLVADYNFLQPVGSFFDTAQGYEHFIIITGASCLASYLVAKLRNAFRRIIQSKIEADESNFMMAKTLALVSHDIRNPLTTTKLGIQMVLKDSRLNEKNSIILKKTLTNIEFANSMIQSLLDVSRIRSGKKLPLHLEFCDLNFHLANMVDEMSLACDRLKYVSEVDSASGEWSLRDIRRALDNLITNAIKYGSKDTPIIIKLSRMNEFVFLQVHNEGKEISARDQEKLFEVYQRTEEAEKGKVEGWGLGLTLVKGVAESHGGSVSLESMPGKGTTFTLKLPVTIRDIRLVEESQTLPPPPPTPSLQYGHHYH